MDESRQQMQHETRQQKMQQEYKKIEKECKKQKCSVNILFDFKTIHFANSRNVTTVLTFNFRKVATILNHL